MQEALFYKKLDRKRVRCELCPWNCILAPEQTGNCKVRFNTNGTLTSDVYNKVAALGIDPIEKKPLYHFYPGKNILSIGEVGCNLHCTFCQNHRISQCATNEFTGFHNITPEQIVKEALKTWNNIGVAYTYNEPITFYEFLFDTAKEVQLAGLKNVLVSNGYINKKPLEKLLPFIDAFNIDLKAFSENFYARYTKGKLQPVLNTLKTIAQSGTHLEITNLIIPGLNDDKNEFLEMVKWIATELGEEIPLHLSRYYPQYKMNISPTPIETLDSLFNMASQHLQHAFLGNVSNVAKSSTYCGSCQQLLIQRNSYNTEIIGISKDGACTRCGTKCGIKL